MNPILALAFDCVAQATWRLTVVLVYVLTFTLAASMLFSPALAQQCAGVCFNPGCLDTYFGNCGTVLTDTSHYANLTLDGEGVRKILVQDDAKLIAAGETKYQGSGLYFAAARYNIDGTLDNTFGSLDPNTNLRTGVVVTPFTYQGTTHYLNYSANAAALQTVPTATGTEERLIQAGHIQNSSGVLNIAVVRYTSAGELDTSFNGTGMQLISFGSTGFYVTSCTIQDNGTAQAKIIIVSGSGPAWSFIRLNADGTLDSSFGTGGRATVGFSSKVGDMMPWAVTMQQTTAGDRILAAGRSYTGKTGNDFTLVRLNLNGSLDPTFGTGGIVTTDFNRNGDQARSLAIDPTTGDIVAAGDAQLSNQSASDIAVARYDQNGKLRSSFGSGGKVTTDVLGLGKPDFGIGVAIQWDGKIVVAGEVSNNNGNFDFGVARYSTSGVLDSTFGSGGKAIKDFAAGSDLTMCMALQTVNGSQRIVVGGGVGVPDLNNPNYGYNFGLARFLSQ